MNKEALQEQRIASAGVDSTVGESSPTLPKEKPEEAYESLGLKIQQLPVDDASGSGLIPPFMHAEFHVDNLVATNNVEEHQFIPSFIQSPLHRNHDDNSELKSLSALRNSSDEDLCFSLQLGDREPKRQRTEPTFSNGSPK